MSPMKPADKKQVLVAYRVTKADAQRIKARKYRHESLSEAARRLALQEVSRPIEVAEDGA